MTHAVSARKHVVACAEKAGIVEEVARLKEELTGFTSPAPAHEALTAVGARRLFNGDGFYFLIARVTRQHLLNAVLD